MRALMQVIRQVRQPPGGYVNPKAMEVHHLGRDGGDAFLDHTIENVHASLVGTSVDYLTRWCLNRQKPPHLAVAEQAFNFSCSGASILDKQLGTNYVSRATDLCRIIDESHDLNPDVFAPPSSAAISAAVELASFDGAFHAGVQGYSPDTNTTPDTTTIQHIATMMDRSLAFFRQYGPALVDGFMVTGGDTAGFGDFVTQNTLLDFKVSVKPPTKDHTLQVLALWIMAQRSDWNWTPTWNGNHNTPEATWCETWDLDAYLRVNRAWPDDLHGPEPTHIGIYNPRLDAVYRLAVESIPTEVIADVSRNVIGYK